MASIASATTTWTPAARPAPNTYSAEAFLMLAAYGALQDWDGLFAFAYSHDGYTDRSIDNFFDLVGHTPKMLTLPAAAAIFRRGDVAPAVVKKSVALSRSALLARMVDRPGDVNQHATGALGLAPHEALVHRIGTEILPASGVAMVTAETSPVPTSATADTGELVWTGAAEDLGRTLVKAPMSKAMVGFLPTAPCDLGDGVVVLSARGMQNWACLTLTRLPDPAPEAQRWLLTLSGYAENTGMAWKDATHTSCGNQWGGGPPLVEVPDIELALPWSPGRLVVHTLDTEGRPAASVPVLPGASAGTSRLALDGGLRSPWFLLDVQSAEVPRGAAAR